MENLLSSTDIATLFLDQQLTVRRYTPRALSVIKLMPGDVGRSITDLASDASQVLKTLKSTEKQIQASKNRWFMVRTMPYRTEDSRIDGVVITCTDVSVAKSLEASLRGDRVVNVRPRSEVPQLNDALNNRCTSASTQRNETKFSAAA